MIRVRLLALVCCTVLFQNAWAEDPKQVEYVGLSGEALIERLQIPESRMRAFYELCRRPAPAPEDRAEVTNAGRKRRVIIAPGSTAGSGAPRQPRTIHRLEPTEDRGFSLFSLEHPEPEVRISRPGGNEPPVYLVIYGTKKEQLLSLESLQEGKRPEVNLRRGEHLGTVVFNAKGERVDSSGFSGLLDGVLADLNADGSIEIASLSRWQVDQEAEVTVLEIAAAGANWNPPFCVSINWDGKDWEYRVKDEDKDGVYDIEAGPVTENGFRAEVVWRWDAPEKRYSGPVGGAGQNYQVLEKKEILHQLNKLKEEKLARTGVETAAPDSAKTAECYRYKSLREATDAEIFQFMSASGQISPDEARLVAKPEPGSYFPKNGWQMDAKSAALDILEGNRGEKAKRNFNVSVDDADGKKPPAICSLTFGGEEANGYSKHSFYYFLKLDPAESYLAFAGARSRTGKLYSRLHEFPEYDLRFLPLDYEKAKKISDILWWLDRANTRRLSADDGIHSRVPEGDGKGMFLVRSVEGAFIRRDGALWLDRVERRWTDGYSSDVFLTLTAHLFSQALPEYLGEEWQAQGRKSGMDLFLGDMAGAYYNAEEEKRLADTAVRFLKWFSVDEKNISYPVVNLAVGCVASLLYVPSARDLERILGKLPETQMARPKETRGLEEVLSIESSENLRQATIAALEEIAEGSKEESLYLWALSERSTAPRAMARLAKMNPAKYAEVLEKRITEKAGAYASQYFVELQKIDPERAIRLAQAVPPQSTGPLTIPAMAVLTQAGADVQERIPGAIGILNGSTAGVVEKMAAIEILVPRDNPLLYPDGSIDGALGDLVSKNAESEMLTKVAADAIIRRGQIEFINQIFQVFNGMSGNLYVGEQILAAGVLASQKDPAQFQLRLREVVASHLKETSVAVPELLWAAWAGDLRELQPRLKELATRDPAEAETRSRRRAEWRKMPVDSRYHLARCVVGLWNEQDALTRLRMLTAFVAANEDAILGSGHEAREARLSQELAAAAKQLPAGDKARLATFLEQVGNEKTVEYVRSAVGLSL